MTPFPRAGRCRATGAPTGGGRGAADLIGAAWSDAWFADDEPDVAANDSDEARQTDVRMAAAQRGRPAVMSGTAGAPTRLHWDVTCG